MSLATLSITERAVGRKNVNGLRRAGRVPAVVYGHGFASEPVAVVESALERFIATAHDSPIVELVGIGEHSIPAVIQDVQRDALKGTILHVDFRRLRMEERLTTKVSVALVGESPAVKAHGAVLVKVLAELDVTCLPQDLVSSIAVDIAGLAKVHDHVRVRDIVPPSGVRILNDADDIVVTIQEPQREDVVSEKPVENVEAVEVVGAKKEKESPDARGGRGGKEEKEEKGKKQ